MASISAGGVVRVSTGSRPAVERCWEKAWSVTRIGRSEPSIESCSAVMFGICATPRVRSEILLLDAELGAVDAVADDAQGRQPAALDGGVEGVGEVARDPAQVLVGGALQLVAGDADEVLADEGERRGGEECGKEEELGAEREAHQAVSRVVARADRENWRFERRSPACAGSAPDTHRLRPGALVPRPARARPEGGPRRPPSTPPALPDREEGGAAQRPGPGWVTRSLHHSRAWARTVAVSLAMPQARPVVSRASARTV